MKGGLTVLKLTHDQAEKVDALVQGFEDEMPGEDILDITLAIMEGLTTIAFMETTVSLKELREHFGKYGE